MERLQFGWGLRRPSSRDESRPAMRGQKNQENQCSGAVGCCLAACWPACGTQGRVPDQTGCCVEAASRLARNFAHHRSLLLLTASRPQHCSRCRRGAGGGAGNKAEVSKRRSRRARPPALPATAGAGAGVHASQAAGAPHHPPPPPPACSQREAGADGRGGHGAVAVALHAKALQVEFSHGGVVVKSAAYAEPHGRHQPVVAALQPPAARGAAAARHASAGGGGAGAALCGCAGNRRQSQHGLTGAHQMRLAAAVCTSIRNPGSAFCLAGKGGTHGGMLRGVRPPAQPPAAAAGVGGGNAGGNPAAL